LSICIVVVVTNTTTTTATTTTTTTTNFCICNNYVTYVSVETLINLSAFFYCKTV
jgi:hypothetical protein